MWNTNWITFKLICIKFCLLSLSDCGWSIHVGSHFHRKFDTNPTTLSPVIIIPGLGGAAMQAKLDKFSFPNPQCYKTSEYQHIWLNPIEMMPDTIDCWVDKIKLTYSSITRKTTNPSGVAIKLPAWGRTDGIDWIDTSPLKNIDNGAYFEHITEALTNRGYIREKNLFGAAYDFRKGPNENKVWFRLLESLTQMASEMNHHIGVTFIAHSMGGRMILQFLQKMPQSWKDQYVKQVITLSSPWGGSMVPMQAISIGYSFGMDFIIKREKMKKALRTFPSLIWLMPSKNTWNENEVLATVANRNYTLRNIDQFFYDTHNPNAVEMRKDLLNFGDFSAPGVELHCLYGNDVETIEKLDFGKSLKASPKMFKGNGDGTVNKRSLIGCGSWKNTAEQANHQIYQQEYSGVNHYGMLSDSEPINYILKILTGHQDYPRLKEYRNDANIINIRLF